VLLFLLLAGGVAAAGVYGYREWQARQQDGAAASLPPAPAGRADLAGEGVDGGASAAAPEVVDAGASTAPGHGGGGAVAGNGTVVVKPDAGPAAPANYRVVTLGEKGYAVRILVPPTVIAGDEVMVVMEVWDPKGKPLAARELRVVIEEPSGVERAITMPQADEDGRYAARRRFPAGGHYHFHIYPGGARADVLVWFDFEVYNPDGTLPPKAKHGKGHDKDRGANAKKTGGGTTKPDDNADPYHMIDEAAGGGGGAADGSFGSGGNGNNVTPPPPPPPKTKPDASPDDLE
jgi:hypothetical protein